jgi:hypothetical protein
LQPQVVVGADWPHVHVVTGTGRWSLHDRGHQLLVREKSGIWPASNREKAAAIPLVLTALLLLKPPQSLLASILLL